VGPPPQELGDEDPAVRLATVVALRKLAKRGDTQDRAATAASPPPLPPFPTLPLPLPVLYCSRAPGRVTHRACAGRAAGARDVLSIWRRGGRL